MDPGGHDLNNIPMFLDTMWCGGGPYHGNNNKITAGNYNGDWQGAGKKMNWPRWMAGYPEHN